MKSNWSRNSIRTNYGSSYYDFGILDYFDHRLEVARLFEAIGERRNLHCLDLAAGNGRFTEAMLSHAESVTAVDLEEKHTAYLATRFKNGRVLVERAEASAFLASCSSQYDLVIASGLLLFFDDNAAHDLLRSMVTRLKPNGCVFIRDFFSRTEAFALPSRVFPGVALNYRPASFYRSLGFRFLGFARPRHLLPGVERVVFRFLPFSCYRLFWRESLRSLSWRKSPYFNGLIVFRRAAP